MLEPCRCQGYASASSKLRCLSGLTWTVPLLAQYAIDNNQTVEEIEEQLDMLCDAIPAVGPSQSVFDCDKLTDLPDITFDFSDAEFTLSPDQYILRVRCTLWRLLSTCVDGASCLPLAAATRACLVAIAQSSLDAQSYQTWSYATCWFDSCVCAVVYSGNNQLMRCAHDR